MSFRAQRQSALHFFIYIVPVFISVAFVLLIAFSPIVHWLALRSSVFEKLYVGIFYDDPISMVVLVISFFAGMLCVSLIMHRIISRHKGESDITFNTYIDNNFYSEFCKFSWHLSVEERIYLSSQQNIKTPYQRIKRSPSTETEDQEKNTAHQLKSKATESLTDNVARIDELYDLPDFDPDGPNPFSK